MKEMIQTTLVFIYLNYKYDIPISNNDLSLTLIYKFTNIEGTRRSTRKRKLKYENYSDTWIVGSQALKGYPNMVNEEDGKTFIEFKLYPKTEFVQ